MTALSLPRANAQSALCPRAHSHLLVAGPDSSHEGLPVPQDPQHGPVRHREHPTGPRLPGRLHSCSEYVDAFNDVKQLGSLGGYRFARGRRASGDRSDTGRRKPSTARETGLWLKAALDHRRASGHREFAFDTRAAVALIAMATADAVAVSWTNKFDYHSWRPADAIRATGANVDGNPATVEDPTCRPRAGIGNFGGTPEYTSGSATFAGAASTVLQGFYCRDDIAFSFEGEYGTVRWYTELFTGRR